MWLLSKGGNPSQFSRHRNTLTILTLGADELFLRHGLQAETLQVEHAAALALAGQQRLARALADLQQAESSAGNRVPRNASDCQVVTTGTACNCFRIRVRQETEPGKPLGRGQSQHSLHLALGYQCEAGQSQERHHSIHLHSSFSQGTSCSCSSGPLLLTRKLARRFQDFFFPKY